MKSLHGQKLVIATHNKGKVPEIAALLAPFNVEVTSAGELNISEPEETEITFKGNALLKARHSAEQSGLPALADDSGLSVDALDGQPGIYSARWAIKDGVRDFNFAMDKLNSELADKKDKTARFICALAIVWPDGEEFVVEGEIEGDIIWPMRGDNGFGYDPVFQPKGDHRSFAEMDPAEKHAMSHRARAFAQLIEHCFSKN